MHMLWLYIMLKLKLLLLFLFNHTKKNLHMFPFLLLAWTFINWIMSVSWLESGSTGKYQHSVMGVHSGCALRNSLNIMMVFPCTPLGPYSRLGTASVQVKTVMYSAIQWSVVQYSEEHLSTVQGSAVVCSAVLSAVQCRLSAAWGIVPGLPPHTGTLTHPSIISTYRPQAKGKLNIFRFLVW